MPRPLPNGKWMGDARAIGGQRKTFNTKEEAEQYEANPKGEQLKPTVGAVFRHGFKVLWQRSKNHRDQYMQTEEWIGLLGENSLVASVSTALVQDKVLLLLDKGNSEKRVNRKLNTLNMLMNHALDRGLVTAAPKIKKFSEGGGRTRFFTEEEVGRIFSRMSEPYLSFARFLLGTGGRVGECLALRWQDIYNTKVTFRWQTTKGGKTRTLPLTNLSLSSIAFARLHFHNQAGPWTEVDYDTFHEVFTRAKEKAGLGDDPEVVPHTLRHTCASWMVQRGVGIEVVQKWLGHASITTTMRYAHLAPNALDTAASVLNSHADIYPYGLPKGLPECHLNGNSPEVNEADLPSVISRLDLVGECPERQRGRTVNPGKT